MENTQRLFSLCVALFCLQGLMLAQDGTLDPTFNVRNLSGLITYSPNLAARDLARQADGQLVIAVEANGLSVMRLNANGAVDSAFGTNGQVVTDFNAREDVCLDIKLLNDGKVLAAGYAIALGGTTNAARNLGIARYLPSTGTATILVTRFPTATTYKYLTLNWANDAQYRIVTSQFNGQFTNSASGLSLYVNGALQNAQGNSSGAVATLEISDAMYIPARVPGNCLRGNIAELIAYSRLVTNAERDSVERYLSQKYNIPLQTLSTKENEAGLPQSFALSQNYPNPFNPTITIGYALPQASQVRLTVYDVLGREVATLVNARQAAGNYTANFNASHLASGIYFYRLEASTTGVTAGSFVETKKMMLVK